MAKRAKGFTYPTKKAKSGRDDNTAVLQAGRKSVKVLSSEDHKYVGRSGHGGYVAGVQDGKDSVKRVMKRDPSRGTSLPAADKITSTKVDLIGVQNPSIVAKNRQATANSGLKVVRPPRKSLPVRSNSPGKVSRGPR